MEEKLNGKPGHERLDPIQFMTASEEREYMRATNPLAVNATNYTYYQRRKKRRLEQRENLPPHEAVLSLLGRAKYMRVRTNYFQPPPKEQETLADEPQESEEQSKFDFEKDDVVIEREGVAVQADADVFDPITTEKADDSYANPLGGDMNALFFANTDGYRFWRAYSEVVMVDATYITGFNRNKYCLVNISGVCALNKSFPFACCFVAEETQVSYKWVFTQLRDMFDNYRIPYPKVVVTDGGKQVISASESVVLNVPVGISSWHCNEKIREHANRYFKGKRKVDKVMKAWNDIISAETEEGMETCKAYFCNNFSVDLTKVNRKTKKKTTINFIEYVDAQWFPDATFRRLARFYTDQNSHFYHNMASRVESMHHQYKLVLGSKKKDLFETTKLILEKIKLIYEFNNLEMAKALREVSLHQRCVSAGVFNDVFYKISPFALQRILEIRAMQEDGDYLDCKCSNVRSVGIPCRHTIRQVKELRPSGGLCFRDFSPHWRNMFTDVFGMDCKMMGESAEEVEAFHEGMTTGEVGSSGLHLYAQEWQRLLEASKAHGVAVLDAPYEEPVHGNLAKLQSEKHLNRKPYLAARKKGARSQRAGESAKAMDLEPTRNVPDSFSGYASFERATKYMAELQKYKEDAAVMETMVKQQMWQVDKLMAAVGNDMGCFDYEPFSTNMTGLTKPPVPPPKSPVLPPKSWVRVEPDEFRHWAQSFSTFIPELDEPDTPQMLTDMSNTIQRPAIYQPGPIPYQPMPMMEPMLPMAPMVSMAPMMPMAPTLPVGPTFPMAPMMPMEPVLPMTPSLPAPTLPASTLPIPGLLRSDTEQL